MLIKASFPIGETDCLEWLPKAERFARKYFGVDVKLSEIFALPKTLPWRNILPCFIPAGTDNHKAMEVLEKMGFCVWEDVDVMEYSHSGSSNSHQLLLIERSEKPTKSTMRKSPNILVKEKTLYIGLQGYAIGFGLYHQETQSFLDSETFTWFPDDRLPLGRVAYGRCCSDYRGVKFYWSSADFGSALGGARLAIRVPLKSQS